MDVESRLLLHTVALGAGASVVLISVARRWSMWFSALVSALLLLVAVLGLLGLIRLPGLEWWLLGAFLFVQLGPAAALEGGAVAFRRRRFGLAAALSRTAAVLLGGAAPVLRRARTYAAIADIDAGREERGLATLEHLAGELPADADAAERAGRLVQPPFMRRDWEGVLRVLDHHPAGRPVPDLLVAEVHGAAGTGDVTRAMRALVTLEGALPEDDDRVAAARRAVLAAAGRVAFLRAAIDDGLPVMHGHAAAREKAVARALEAAGRADEAREAYERLARRGSGLVSRDAEADARRCGAGRPRLVPEDEVLASAVLDLEARCRAQPLPARARPWIVRYPVTTATTAVTLLASAMVWSFVGTTPLDLAAAGALSSPLVRVEHQWWRLLTTMLLHVGWIHLSFNLSAILVVGAVVERCLGAARWLIVYVVSGVLASMASVYVQDTPLGVGASGAAMGLLGALALLLLRRPRLFPPRSRRRWLIATGLTVVGTVYVGLLEAQAVDNAAHVGGLVVGFAVAWVLAPGRQETTLHESVRRLVATLLVALVALGAGLALQRLPRWVGERSVEVRGARAVLPRFLHVATDPGVGALASRPPFELRIQVGAFPLAKESPAGVLPTADAARWFERGADEVREVRVVGDLVEERALYVPEEPRPELAGRSEIDAFGFELVRLRRGRAFALVVFPAPRATEYEPVLEQLRTTLRSAR